MVTAGDIQIKIPHGPRFIQFLEKSLSFLQVLKKDIGQIDTQKIVLELDSQYSDERMIDIKNIPL
jgi:hypothetical protein